MPSPVSVCMIQWADYKQHSSATDANQIIVTPIKDRIIPEKEQLEKAGKADFMAFLALPAAFHLLESARQRLLKYKARRH